MSHDERADWQLVDAVSQDLRRDDGRSTAAAVRAIRTADHLDEAARRPEGTLVAPVRTAVAERALAPGR